MKKIGIVTHYLAENYGTTLQAYALLKKIKEMGYETYFISHFDYQQFSYIKYVLYICKKILISIGIRGLYLKFKSNNIKIRKLRNFQSKYEPVKNILTKSQYKKLIDKTDIFITGSDQIWNPYCLSTFMLLDFVPNKKKKIAYASSVGTLTIPQEMLSIYEKHLSGFRFISLREMAGVDLISKVLKRKDIEKVLDPTFLLTPQEWSSISQQSKFEIIIPSTYILCYLLGKRFNYIEQIDSIVRQTGIKNIILIPSFENKDFIYKDATIYRGAGINEFLYLIEKATLVCTDSFHGTALSINFSKQFVEFMRFKDDDIKSQNSRIYELLEHYNLMERIYTPYNRNWLNTIDYSKIQSLLNSERQKSINFLINSIEND